MSFVMFVDCLTAGSSRTHVFGGIKLSTLDFV